jgi:hypothetical protein
MLARRDRTRKPLVIATSSLLLSRLSTCRRLAAIRNYGHRRIMADLQSLLPEGLENSAGARQSLPAKQARRITLRQIEVLNHGMKTPGVPPKVVLPKMKVVLPAMKPILQTMEVAQRM